MLELCSYILCWRNAGVAGCTNLQEQCQDNSDEACCSFSRSSSASWEGDDVDL